MRQSSKDGDNGLEHSTPILALLHTWIYNIHDSLLAPLVVCSIITLSQRKHGNRLVPVTV